MNGSSRGGRRFALAATLLGLLMLTAMTGCRADAPVPAAAAPAPPAGQPAGPPSLPPPVTQRAGPPPNPAKLGTVERDITYATVEGVALKMDIYYPMTAEQAAPAVLYVHGGGWTSGDKGAGAGTVDTPELRSRGYLVAAINYRLAPMYKFPAQIEDVKAAIRFLRANAAEYGINPARIGAFGGSAGGHLVALLGVTDSSAGLEGSGGHADQSSRVQAVVDLFGPSDLTVFFGPSAKLEEVFGSPDPLSDIARTASPVTWVTKDDPPFLIIHGDRDTVVPLGQSQRLYDRLVVARVPATLVVVKNGAHGLAPRGTQTSPSRSEITKMIADFFDRHLK